MERNAELKQFSQELRKNPTKEEALLWYRFLRKYSPRFRRQYIVGNYILDFYCHQARIAVELDGSQHYEPDQVRKDQDRTDCLNKQGIKVLRFTNIDVLQRFTNVCEAINEEVKNTLPRGEGGPRSGG